MPRPGERRQMDNMRSRAGGLKAYENRQAQDGREEAYIIKGLRM